MRIWSLGSGSKGNAVLVECGDTRVLVDAGFGVRTLGARLSAIGVAPDSIAACVITHEHEDHTRGAAAAAACWGWSLHASAGTRAGSPGLAAAPVQTFVAGASLTVGRAEIHSVPVSHDGAEPVGYIVTDLSSGARAAIVYDLGEATPAVREAVRGVDVLVIESNHDEGMLRCGPYPRFLQARISCRTGHLSNRAAAALGAECAHAGLHHVVLAHLSEKNNDSGVATSTMARSLARTRFRGQVSTAPQHSIVGPFTPTPSRLTPVATQLALTL